MFILQFPKENLGFVEKAAVVLILHAEKGILFARKKSWCRIPFAISKREILLACCKNWSPLFYMLQKNNLFAKKLAAVVFSLKFQKRNSSCLQKQPLSPSFCILKKKSYLPTKKAAVVFLLQFKKKEILLACRNNCCHLHSAY